MSLNAPCAVRVPLHLHKPQFASSALQAPLLWMGQWYVILALQARTLWQGRDCARLVHQDPTVWLDQLRAWIVRMAHLQADLELRSVLHAYRVPSQDPRRQPVHHARMVTLVRKLDRAAANLAMPGAIWHPIELLAYPVSLASYLPMAPPNAVHVIRVRLLHPLDHCRVLVVLLEAPRSLALPSALHVGVNPLFFTS